MSHDQRERFLIPYAGSFAPLNIQSASGSWIEDISGKRILDFTSGQICSTVGHNHPKIVAAINEACRTAIHLNSWILSEPVLALAERLAAVTPGALDRSILLNTGSEANEVAIKLAKLHTGRFEVVGLTSSFHGLIGNVLAVTFQKARRGYGPLAPGVFSLPAPYSYRCPVRHCRGQCDCTCLDVGFELIDAQSTGQLCAVIAEPIMSSGGVIVPPDGYFKRLRALCDARNMLLIFDEAQTGFGRLGTMFGFQHDGVVPDLLALSKTLGGGIPLAATMTTSLIADDCVAKGLVHVTSHVSDPLPAYVGLAVLDVIKEEDLVNRARAHGEYLITALRELQDRYEQIGEVRGRGLLVGVELVEDRESRTPAASLAVAVTNECLDRGLSMNIGRRGGNSLRIAPPLTVSDDEIDIAVQILDDSFKAVLASPSRPKH